MNTPERDGLYKLLVRKLRLVSEKHFGNDTYHYLDYHHEVQGIIADHLAEHYTPTSEVGRLVREAQTNAVAWTIGVIDDLHTYTDSDLNQPDDKIYKGIKNTIRDKYKFIIGIDPAPKYPVDAQLKAEQPLKGGE